MTPTYEVIIYFKTIPSSCASPTHFFVVKEVKEVGSYTVIYYVNGDIDYFPTRSIERICQEIWKEAPDAVTG